MQQEVEDRLTRAIAGRSLVLQELASEQGERSMSLMAVIESDSKQADLQGVTDLLQSMSGVTSIEVTTKDADSE